MTRGAQPPANEARGWAPRSGTTEDGSASSAARREAFEASLGFPVDPFQARALDALDAGRSVVVAAPTGSGKTVVAEYALALALAEGGKAFYTTPLKALSNQKYAELCDRHGVATVGLLTGDNAINGDADVVVMTTEVLRNMIYAGSASLARLRYVILDEVHYLQNPYRGAVWEEVIIHTAPEVDLVCLSATVSNAEELTEWIGTVRGATTAVIEERRPVQLHHLYLVGDRRAERLHLLPTFVDGQPNPEATALEAACSRPPRLGPEPGGPRRHRSRLYAPRRAEVVTRLDEEAMLPAIYFIFSRAACDDAVRSCLAEGIRLTVPEERRRIRAIAEAKVAALSDVDLSVLGYGPWLAGLEAGVAAHHAGMVPAFKETVEACFGEALVKAVFATETLSLGINMPARAVVIEKLSKFTGERHETLTAGEYTQLTGRAGRRGIDEVGYAVVLWSPFVPFGQVAGLASTRTYALTSSFRPTYNMAANLVRRYPPEVAHHLLNLSFAQYRSDAEVVHLEAQLDRLRRAEAQARERAHCQRGDVEALRRHELGRRDGLELGGRGGLELGGRGGPEAALGGTAARGRPLRRESRRARGRPTGSGGAGSGGTGSLTGSRADVEGALDRLRPGDVLAVPGTVAGGRLAVVATSRRRGGDVRLAGVSVDTRKVVLGAADFSQPPRPVARVDLPAPYDPGSTRFLRATAAALRRLDLGALPMASGAGPALPMASGADRARIDGDPGGGTEGPEMPAAVLGAMSCPEIRAHLRAAARADRLAAEADRLERRIRTRSESLARQLDRVLGLMEAWGCVEGWALTPAGERLSRVYHELDLLVAHSLEQGLLDGLAPPDLAGLVSVFTYESRGPAGGPDPTFPDGESHRRWLAVEAISEELAQAEERAGLPPTRAPDPGFLAPARAWAAGQDLERVIGDDALSGGDFVRNVKQLIDLMGQVARVAPDPSTARAARRAGDALFRGVVAASSVVEPATVRARAEAGP